MFFNVSQTTQDTFVEIIEPGTPIIERETTSLMPVNNFKKDLIIEDETKRFGATGSFIACESNAISRIGTLKSNNLKTISKSKSTVDISVPPKKKKDSEIYSEFPYYDIPLEKLRKREEPKEFQQLRKIFPDELARREHKQKLEAEFEKKQKKNLFEMKIKKDIDSKLFTFDPNGVIIPLKKQKFDAFNLGNEFYWSRSSISEKKIFSNPYINKTPEENVEVIKNVDLSGELFQNFKVEKEKKEQERKIKSIPMGSNFDLIKPEIGVVVKEEDKEKVGSREYSMKYNRTSAYEYSRLLNESSLYNEGMVKRGIASEIHEQLTQDQPYYGYNENIESSVNPLMANATGVTDLPKISFSHCEDVKSELVSTQNNPLIAKTSFNHLYSSDKGKILANDEGKRLLEVLKEEYDIKDGNKAMKRNKSEKIIPNMFGSFGKYSSNKMNKIRLARGRSKNDVMVKFVNKIANQNDAFKLMDIKGKMKVLSIENFLDLDKNTQNQSLINAFEYKKRSIPHLPYVNKGNLRARVNPVKPSILKK